MADATRASGRLSAGRAGTRRLRGPDDAWTFSASGPEGGLPHHRSSPEGSRCRRGTRLAMSRRSPTPPSRFLRGRSWREAPLIALDFETTGLDLRRDTVVSFGLVPIREGRIEMAGARYREISPQVPPSPESIRIHHLRQRDLELAPSLEDVREELAAGLEGQFLVTWVAEVEASFLAKI